MNRFPAQVMLRLHGTMHATPQHHSMGDTTTPLPGTDALGSVRRVRDWCSCRSPLVGRGDLSGAEAAGARDCPARVPGRRSRPAQHRDDEALGRSRGGLTCKIHLASDGGRRPLAIVVTPGQWGDAPQLIPVLERIRVPCPAGGHLRTQPDHVSGDKAYSSRPEPAVPAAQAHQAHHPRAQGSAGPPPTPRKHGRQTHRFRQDSLPKEERGGAHGQRTQRLPGSMSSTARSPLSRFGCGYVPDLPGSP